FMQRAYDQVIHDVCIQNLHVVFCLDRAGFAGADGPTHHGNYDIAYMRCLPNMVVSAPMNESELRNLMYTAQLPREGAFTIRYPRGQGVLPEWRTPLEEIKVGTGRMICEGDDLAILSLGHIGNYAVDACGQLDDEEINAAHYDMRFAKPLDENLLHVIFKKFDHVITIEDGCLQGGFGSSILEFMADHGYQSKVVRLGIKDEVIEHGSQEQLHKESGFDVEGIVAAAKKMLDAVAIQ
ncbi:MAG: 1-deoxy-D-xylulose-5-phosphate synthase, partial [Parvicella sp.]